MRAPFPIINPQFYMLNSKGKKTSVVFDIAEWQQFTEEIEDLYLSLIARAGLEKENKDDFIPHEKVVKGLKARISKSKRKK